MNVLYTSQKLHDLFCDDQSLVSASDILDKLTSKNSSPAEVGTLDSLPSRARASGDGDGVPGRCCRLCGGDNNLRYFGDTYVWQGVEERYDQLLNDCFGVKVTQSDCMICEWCVRALRTTGRFRALVRTAFDVQNNDRNEAKKAWEKLRNNHRDALRRQSKPKSGPGAANIRPWRFQDNMAFLIPHMANRYTHPSEDMQNDDTSQDARDNDIQENLTEDEASKTNQETNQSSGRISTVKVNKRWRQKRLNRSMEEHQRVAKRQRERERPTTNDFTVNNAKNDPLFHFFMSMYETTKRLPPLSQHTIKTSIFSCVSQEESKILIQYSPRPHSSNTPGSYYVSYTPSPVQQAIESLPAETVPIIKQENLEMNAEVPGNMFAYTVDPFN